MITNAKMTQVSLLLLRERGLKNGVLFSSWRNSVRKSKENVVSWWSWIGSAMLILVSSSFSSIFLLQQDWVIFLVLWVLTERKRLKETSLWQLGLAGSMCTGIQFSSKLSSINLFVETVTHQWIRGAMVARLTPDQKVACSIHVGFNSFFILLNYINIGKKIILKYFLKN